MHSQNIADTNSSGKKQTSFTLWLGICVIVLTIIACCAALKPGGSKAELILSTPTVLLQDRWTDSAGSTHRLPLKLRYQGDPSYSYETVLPKTSPIENPVILVEGKYLNTRFYLNDQPLGEYFCSPPGAPHTHGKCYLFLSLPDDFAGMRLRMEGEMLLGDTASYEIAAPMLGDKAQILFNIIMLDLPILLTILVIICFGCLLFLFSFQASLAGTGSTFFHTGLFSILFALYSLFSTQTIYFICPSGYLIYVGEFLLLSLLPLPLLSLLHHRSIPPYQKLLKIDIWLVFGNFIMINLLHFFLNIEFRRTLLATHSVMVLSLALMIFSILFASPTAKDRRNLLVTFSPIIFGTVANLLLFYLPIVQNKVLLFLLCVLVFVLLETYHLIRSYLNACEESMKSQFYHRIAYTDALTGIANRAAFEEKVIELSEPSAAFTSLWCICADINGLKQTNDQLGHAKGDQLINDAAACLKTALFEHTFLYRTGGDEFVAFALDCSEKSLTDALLKLDQTIDQHNRRGSPAISIAVGFDCLRDRETDTIPELIKRADAMMYRKKRAYKLNSSPSVF